MTTAPRVLLIAPTRIGDAVLFSGAIDGVRRLLPAAEVTVACSALTAPLYRGFDEVTAVWTLTTGSRLARWRALWRRAWPVRWDLVVDLRGSAFAYLVRTRRRLIHNPRETVGLHRVEAVSAVLRSATPLSPRLPLDETARASADAVLGRAGPLIVLAPVAASSDKTWEAQNWARLVERLLARPEFQTHRVAVIAAADERIGATPALQAAGKRSVDAIGALDLPGAAALLARADLFIGNDSGLGHMAAAVGAPSLVLFGPTDARLYRPWGERTAIVRAGEDRGPIEALTVDQVERAAIALARETEGL
ncbi:glycosyltransferase family 9 protein [Brevundimonas sp. S30B]|uniref:glycosyltransferase family 9 protein n=1 Tax=unclassified Brevundimonas TaxID=2622653 RepID=UPI001071A478|nr:MULTISPECIES: glycosyltransferase family 9 protein [unclassified Brevundimonas]QBX36811.1 glycosyltransferase family 9 protein [Brevundimonas sp. MF30-B]TFW04394.1 glycosyltransferase family 9 protein [Brevundimonas sp. S30B]